MYDGKTHALFAKYAIPQMIGLLFNSIYLGSTEKSLYSHREALKT